MKMNLNEGWELRPEGLEKSALDWPLIERKTEGWYEASLPCDVRMPLIEKGVIPEPLEGLNCYESEWVEDRSWWFRKRFAVGKSVADAAAVRLRFEMLDVEADVFLNGRLVGHQRSAFYPFEADVKDFLIPGENTLGVRLTCGLERVKDEDFAGYSRCIATEALAGRGTRGDRRRALLRKPQYVFGWDWGPRVATCAIAGDASLEVIGAALISSVHAVTTEVGNGKARVRVTVEAENTHPFSTLESAVAVKLRDGSRLAAEASSDSLLRSGVNHVDLVLEVPDAKLWWPNGFGDQNLYDLEVSLSSPGLEGGSPVAETAKSRIGLRTLSLDQRPEFGGRRFALVINGVTVHCKGSDWIPADSLYARVTREKYRTLVAEAAEANFSMLRIWGGGRYEDEAFYEACDERGILLWHDFMFACALYPDNRDWFREEVRREAEYQTRRLRNHPSMALWCGSNENNWGFDEWWNGGKNPTAPFWGGAEAYNYLLPESVRANCPETPYWNGSPYGGAHPNSFDAGDCHYWGEATMSLDMAKRIAPESYDKVQARFVTEYGYIGPCVESSIVRYHGGKAIDRTGPIYQLHNNTFEKDTVIAGIEKHYRDTKDMSFRDYLLYASLVQGLMYGYSLESLRSNPRNNGSLFWMYSDCWGEVGWTIIDYYLKRKPSYYFVKRAFMPLRLVLREDSGSIAVTGINDTAADFSCEVEYGSVGLDGTGAATKKASLVLPARSRSVALRFEKSKGDLNKVVDFVRPVGAGESLLSATLRRGEYREKAFADPGLEVGTLERGSGEASFTVTAKAFAHAVHFGLGDEVVATDEYFDLLPGESRRITVKGKALGSGPIEAKSVR
jgi:beta-mannosidase